MTCFTCKFFDAHCIQGQATCAVNPTWDQGSELPCPEWQSEGSPEILKSLAALKDKMRMPLDDHWDGF